MRSVFVVKMLTHTHCEFRLLSKFALAFNNMAVTFPSDSRRLKDHLIETCASLVNLLSHNLKNLKKLDLTKNYGKHSFLFLLLLFEVSNREILVIFGLFGE